MHPAVSAIGIRLTVELRLRIAICTRCYYHEVKKASVNETLHRRGRAKNRNVKEYQQTVLKPKIRMSMLVIQHKVYRRGGHQGHGGTYTYHAGSW